MSEILIKRSLKKLMTLPEVLRPSLGKVEELFLSIILIGLMSEVIDEKKKILSTPHNPSKILKKGDVVLVELKA